MASNTSSPQWINGCDLTAVEALRFLANNDRPSEGEARFNAAHLLQIARELERSIAIVDEQRFASWFEGSKVVDAEGAPLTVYHGTKKGVTTLSPALSGGGLHFGTKAQAEMRAVGGEKQLIAAHLCIRKPARCIDTGGGDWASKIRSAKASGRDGIVYLNRYEGIPPEAFDRALRALAVMRGHAGQRATHEDLDKLRDDQFRQLIPEARDSYIVFSGEQIRPPRPAEEREPEAQPRRERMRA